MVQPHQRGWCVPPAPSRLDGAPARLAPSQQARKTQTLKGGVAVRIAALGAVVATLSLSPAAGAHPGDGVFTIAGDAWLGGARDVAMLADGTVLVTGGTETWQLMPDGQRASIPALRGTGLAATADGVP
jgi:hypothetical protein